MQLKNIFENYNAKINNNRKKPKTIWRRVQCGEDNSNTIREKISVQKKITVTDFSGKPQSVVVNASVTQLYRHQQLN